MAWCKIISKRWKLPNTEKGEKKKWQLFAGCKTAYSASKFYIKIANTIIWTVVELLEFNSKLLLCGEGHFDYLEDPSTFHWLNSVVTKISKPNVRIVP
jgi:hypothetical protein